MKNELSTLLRGTYDPESPLQKLQGQRDVLQLIALDVDKWYYEHIEATDKAFAQLYPRINRYNNVSYNNGKLEFPPPQDININMMPIKLLDLDNTLPPQLHAYRGIIQSCWYIRYKLDGNGNCAHNEDTEVAYLTIHESYVEPGQTHRRPGLHIERPGIVGSQDTRLFKRPTNERMQAICHYSANPQTPTPEERAYMNLAWGLGTWCEGLPVHGIYMASTVDDSCALYPALIVNPWEVTDAHGRCESLRNRLPSPTLTKANKLYWMTDRTPHESLPTSTGGYRQFFRLVVGPISTWYAKHNTANPLCDPEAPISHEDKFK
jgi:hypothetical protein